MDCLSGIVRVPLTQGYVAIIDAADESLVAGLAWFVHRGGTSRRPLLYAKAHTKGRRGEFRRVYMHRLIASPSGRQCVHHRNDNGLDNRRSNIVVCTHTENMRAARNRPNTTSLFRGVQKTPSGTWMSKIAKQYLGTFPTELESALAYDAAARQEFGEFARLNFPESINV